ncbi:hypothetical protein H0H92_001108 [Tricholoma furcatifolium]|nr:hypothetical protein H0H92_001108 [Tricholoma furcatifolium]
MVDIKVIDIPKGYAGFISAISRAKYQQRMTIKLIDTDGDTNGSAVFVGSGENVPMHDKNDTTSTGYSFGPWTYDAKIEITVENQPSDGTAIFRASHSMDPITVCRSASKTSSSMHYRVSTILSEHDKEHNFNDCIVTVFAFKKDRKLR